MISVLVFSHPIVLTKQEAASSSTINNLKTQLTSK